MDKYISDEDLREQLKACGQDVGPINDSTRSYWKKALSKLTIEYGVSPITCASTKGARKKQLCCENKKIVSSNKRSVDSCNYTYRSFSEEELSASGNESFVTDSPGSTPFPAKIQSSKKSPLLDKKISPVESLARYANRKNCHYSTTPNSTRNRKVNRFENKDIRIQQKDRELREKLKEYGESMHRSPMNDAIRNEWTKRLNKLRSGISPVKSNTDISDSEEHQDDFENEYELCSENFRPPKRHLRECMKMLFTFVLKGIVCVIVIIIGIYLMISSEDIKRIEESLD